VEKCVVMCHKLIGTRREAYMEWPVSADTKDILHREKKSKLVLRFCMLEAGEIKFPARWPASVRISLGNEVLFDTLTTGLGMFKATSAGPTNDPPPAIDLTAKALALPGNLLIISLSFKDVPSASSDRHWVVAGLLIADRSESHLLEQVRLRSPLIAECDQRVKTLMGDEEVSCDSIIVSLKDPVLLTRISKAGRVSPFPRLQLFATLEKLLI